MRILLVQNLNYLPEVSGAGRGNRCLLERLSNRGHDCRLLTLSTSVLGYSDRSRYLNELERRSIDITYCSAKLDILRSNGIDVYAVPDKHRLRAQLLDQISNFQPTWTLVSSEDIGQLLLESAISAGHSRIVYLARTTSFLPFGPGSYFEHAAGVQLLHQATGIVSISRFLQGDFQQWANLKASFVPIVALTLGTGPFTDFGCFDSGYVTMINPCAYKGISILLDLAKHMPSVQFAAVPTWGTTTEDITKLKEFSNITILKPVGDIDMIFAQTRILLVPSLWIEAFGRIVAEAMLRGIPVVASNCGGLPEAKLGIDYVIPVRPIMRDSGKVDEKTNPVPIVPEQDIAPWTKAVESLLSNRECYETISKASRDAALAAYACPDESITQFEDYLSSLNANAKNQKSHIRRTISVNAPEMDKVNIISSTISSRRRTLLALRSRLSATCSKDI